VGTSLGKQHRLHAILQVLISPHAIELSRKVRSGFGKHKNARFIYFTLVEIRLQKHIDYEIALEHFRQPNRVTSANNFKR